MPPMRTHRQPHVSAANENPGHQEVRLFLGPRRIVERFREFGACARIFALTPDAQVCLVPLTEELHDAMQKAGGTGDWMKSGVGLSSGDLATAARISKDGVLAYIELFDFLTDGRQHAILWHNGRIAGRPMTLTSKQASARPRALWPANMALRKMNSTSQKNADEAGAMGLYDLMSCEDIAARAIPVE